MFYSAHTIYMSYVNKDSNSIQIFFALFDYENNPSDVHIYCIVHSNNLVAARHASMKLL